MSTATAKITSRATSFELDVKRFYLPGTKVSAPCPECKKTVTDDLGVSHLSYPHANKKFDHTLYCQSCSHEFVVGLVLRVTLEAR